MSNKEVLVKNICEKSNIPYQNNFFGNQTNCEKAKGNNDQIAKSYLEKINGKIN